MKYTRQQIIDKVWTHFVVNKNPRCINPTTRTCSYSGTGCAVGCLIPRRTARLWDNIEDSQISNISGELHRSYSHFFDNTAHTLDLLAQLQQVHDTRYPADRIRVARALGLPDDTNF